MPNNELDINGLDELFNERDTGNGQVEIEPEAEIDLVDPSEVDYRDTSDILRNNIKNANILLAKISYEMNRGNFSARMAEVMSTVLNSVTAATKEIISGDNYKEYLKIRDELVKLKEREVEIKETKITGGNRPTNQNIIVCREDLLKLIDQKKIEEPITVNSNQDLERRNDDE